MDTNVMGQEGIMKKILVTYHYNAQGASCENCVVLSLEERNGNSLIAGTKSGPVWIKINSLIRDLAVLQGAAQGPIVIVDIREA